MNSWPQEGLPFHEGEIAVQERAGVTHKAEAAGRHGIRPFMPDQHRDFFTHLPFLIVGSQDAAGTLTASVLVGEPGFIDSPDPVTLDIAAEPLPGDPLRHNLKVGARLGFLGLQPETRRRNRMNGTVAWVSPQIFSVSVEQSFGNCPQYIQAREPSRIADADVMQEVAIGPRLSDRAATLVRASDTFFIATANGAGNHDDPAGGVDVSHRGGKPGFVRVTEEDGRTVLTVPDFRGNNFFNTLGNIESYPQAGLLFLDFTNGALLQLTVDAEILWDDPAIATFVGAQRLMRFRVRGGRYVENALPLRWSEAELSPQSAKTGAWSDADM